VHQGIFFTFIPIKILEVMNNLMIILQIVVAVSVYYVWTFRMANVITEFKQFGLSDSMRNIVGTSKISVATLLLVGIWCLAITPYAAGLMGFFMLSAQFFHFKNSSPLVKRLPSFLFLVACILIILTSLKIM
jgi:DoxX-like family